MSMPVLRRNRYFSFPDWLIILLFLGLGLVATPIGHTQDEASTAAPFDALTAFYRAITENDWDAARKFSTLELWGELSRSGFIRSWQVRKALRPSLTFSVFLVDSRGLDLERGTAWATGEARWTSSTGPVSMRETVYLTRDLDGWKVARIEHQSSVLAVEKFYLALENQRWNEVRSLTTPDYWLRLTASGIIAFVKRDRASTPGPYVVFQSSDFHESDSTAMVNGSATWKPLTPAQSDTPVTVHLVRIRGAWRIDKIVGHWQEAK
ncbi:MAG: hypothetical protein H5U02_05160 [Clostridia bacterium]|nr:hypothetical protein [Clostridia bacterium]